MKRSLSFLLSVLVLLPGTALRQDADAANQETSLEPDLLARKSEVIQTLSLHTPADCEISSDSDCIIRINVDAGQFLHIVVDHWGDDINIAIFDPTGKKINDIVYRLDEPDNLFWLSRYPGTWKITATVSGKDPSRGRCHFELEEMRAATRSDEKRVKAGKVFSEGEALQSEGTAVSARKATAKYSEALILWKAIADKHEGARTLRRLGESELALGNSTGALERYQQALQIVQKRGDKWEEAMLFNDMAAACRQLNRYQESLDYCNRALRLSHEVEDKRLEAQALWNFGEGYSYSGQQQKSMSPVEEALSIWVGLADRRGQARAHWSMGFILDDLNEGSKAQEHFNLALALSRAVGDPRDQALSLMGLGHLCSRIGEKQQALNYYEEAKPLFESIGDRYWADGLLNAIAYVYEGLGEKRKALENYESAVRLNRLVKSPEGEAEALCKIGRIYSSLGDGIKALEYLEKALLVYRALDSKRLGFFTLEGMGKAFELLENPEKALKCYDEALTLAQEEGFKGEEGIILNDIGHLFAVRGENETAYHYYLKALPLNRATHDLFGEAETLRNMAVLEEGRGNTELACSYLETATQVIESIRSKVAPGGLRTTYFATARQCHELYVELLMQASQKDPSSGTNAVALQASERARARSLLDSLGEARADIRQGVDPALLERERSLQQALRVKAEREMRLLSGKHNDEEATALAKEISSLTADYEEVQRLIRSKSPSYAALTQPQPLGLQEIQQQVLDDQTLLLEFALGDVHSYLWAVTSTTLHSYELPPRAEIETAARRVSGLLLARQPKAGETARQFQLRAKNADIQYWQEAATLSQILLGPAAELLEKKRLLIVSEGVLQYLPFGALPSPDGKEGERGKGGKGETGKISAEEVVPLIVEHEIVNLPSASVMAVLRRETRDRPSPAKLVAVLADPVFEADDPRLARNNSTRPRATAATRPQAPVAPASYSTGRQIPSSPSSVPVSDLHRALRDVGMSRGELSVPRLPATRQEAKAIMAMVPEGAGFLLVLDFNASRATATSPELSQYRIVHFATHGLLNSEHPELSGLVLSLLDEQGKPQDGFLRLNDIYNLKLPVELVVLSACNSGLGKEVKGEGLVGIVRGFMYAGAARVVASLWKVDDEATAELMKRFYQHMLQNGEPASAALRAAQVEMWQQKQWRSPYYWAAFVLEGEWK